MIIYHNIKKTLLIALYVSGHSFDLENASFKVKNDFDMVLYAVKCNGLLLKDASDVLKKDSRIILEAIKNNANAFKYVDKEIKNNKEVLLEILNVCDKDSIYSIYDEIISSSDELRNDRELALVAAKKCVFVIENEMFSEELKKDSEIIEIIIEAFKYDFYFLNYLLPHSIEDRNLFLKLIDIYESIHYYNVDAEDLISLASYNLFIDYDLALKMVNLCGNTIQDLCDEYLEDEEILLAAVKNDIDAILYLNYDQINDVINTIISSNGLEYLIERVSLSKESTNSKIVILRKRIISKLLKKFEESWVLKK